MTLPRYRVHIQLVNGYEIVAMFDDRTDAQHLFDNITVADGFVRTVIDGSTVAINTRNVTAVQLTSEPDVQGAEQ